MLIAVWTARKISEDFTELHGALRSKGMPKPQTTTPPAADTETPAQALSYAELILGSANVLFLCFGMTGMMILVNNNLARAFAIAAAIAVVRFRIKMDSQGLSTALFFGVLVGMACGVGQVVTGGIMTVAYGILQMVVVFMMKASHRKF